jgi:hypothetical protein
MQIREGDNVLLEYLDLGLGALVPKIRTPRKGPFEVTQRVNATTYRDTGLSLATRVGSQHHIHPLFATPLTVSEHEKEEWVEEEPHVVPRDKRHLRFRVRFRGLPDTYDRMYPWVQLANNPQLHAYLCGNDLARLNSARFR